MAGRERSRAARLVRAFVCISAGLVAGVSLYVGFIQAGVIRNPFAPVLRGDLELARSDHAGMRVLFVGNSATYYNAMPGLVQKLAAADEGAQPVSTVWYTAPGWSLRSAAGDDRLRALLEDVRWDAVILQEHSRRASASIDQRRRDTDPYVRDLQRRIAAGGARTVLFMTWWYRDESDLAAVLGLPVAPVGPALVEAQRRRPEFDLWGSDGHTNRAGSYLAACVFYAVLTSRDPSASSFTAGLARSEARFFQNLAAELLDPAWRSTLE